MAKNLNEYVKTKNGVWQVKYDIDGDRYFECTVDSLKYTISEVSDYWKDNVLKTTSNILDVADVLVMVQPGYLPKTMSVDLLKDEKWVNSFVKKIREEGYHYFLSIWDNRYNLKKFAELTTKGIVYLDI